jgi:hypothetical protein
MTYFSESERITGPEYDKVRDEMKMSRTNTVNMGGILRFIYS